MKITTIHNDKESILTTPAKPIDFPIKSDVKASIIDTMNFINTLESPNGVPAGLAAPQVGIHYQFFLGQITKIAFERRKDVKGLMPLTVFINPSYRAIGHEKSKDWEACYSVPEQMGEVWRHQSIDFKAKNIDGEDVHIKADGFLARLLQHETDHVLGILYTEKVTKDCRFGPMSEMMPIREKELILYKKVNYCIICLLNG